MFWGGMETTAQGDLEKLTQSSGSPINHVYADTISGAIVVLCWSPGAGVSGGRGWKMLSTAKACCRELQARSIQWSADWGAVGR